MSLSTQQIENVKDVLRRALRNKFEKYSPEPSAMPFHTRLLGNDRLALYSFIHSLNTSFGTSVFEPVALAIAKPNFHEVDSQKVAGTIISQGAFQVIQEIITELSTAIRDPNKLDEIARLRKVCQLGAMVDVKPTKVDVLIKSNMGELFLFDIKTAKPNAGSFKEFKRTLLEWVATVLAEKPDAVVNTLIAIPYNPYAPEPYNRWTMRGMLDLDNELKVADEFWDYLGGEGTFEALLGCFEAVGIEMRQEIDDYFAKFRTK
ncbi:MAG: TdeIII family type II restriction endonuclease [Pyrinomonadaceae bacterium]